MGFWSALWSGVKAVGSAIASAASALTEGIPGLLASAASWVARKIFSLSEVPSYNPRSATVDETKKVNELLEKCIDGYSAQAKQFDLIARDIIVDQCNVIIKNLEEINGVFGNEIIDEFIFKAFELNLNHTKKDLENIYSKQIANVFSLNNNKLLDILRMDEGQSKQDKLKELAINTISDANDTLMLELSKFINDQQNFITNKLKSYMEARKSDFIVAKNATEQLLNSSEDDKEFKIKVDNNYKNLIDKLDLLDEVLKHY